MILQALTAYYEQLLKQAKWRPPAGTVSSKSAMNCASAPTASSLALNDLRAGSPQRAKKTVIAPR